MNTQNEYIQSKLNWSVICDTINSFAHDVKKMEMLEDVISKHEIQGCVSKYLPQIISGVESDYNIINIIKMLEPYICSISNTTIIKILKYMIVDSIKIDVIKILSPFTGTYNKSDIKAILSEIDEDDNKVNCIEIMLANMISHNNNILNNLITKIVKYISSDGSKINAIKTVLLYMTSCRALTMKTLLFRLSQDSSKIKCVEIMVPKTELTLSDTVQILKNISSDKSTLQMLKVFIQYGLNINYYKIFDILYTMHMSTTRADAIFAFDRIFGSIDNHDKYCKKLATVIYDQNGYIKVANKLNLDGDSIERYKPRNDCQYDDSFETYFII